MNENKNIMNFTEIDKNDIPLVGGKGANLGELTQKGVNVPPGFCVTAPAYDKFIEMTELAESIKEIINNIDMEDNQQLNDKSKEVRDLIINSEIPEVLKNDITEAYLEFSKKVNLEDPYVAIRSSATAEDLPEASFAGQQDTYLEISGVEEVLKYVKKCWLTSI